MPRTGLWLRVFVALLLAILPPIVLLLAAERLTESLFAAENATLVAVVVFLGALGWAAMLALVFTGGLADEVRSFLSLAERGADRDAPDSGDAYRQMAVSLDERNRQLDTLAREASQRADRRRAARRRRRARVRGADGHARSDVALRGDDVRHARPAAAGVYHGDRRRTCPTSRSASSSAGHRSPTPTARHATSRDRGARSRSPTWPSATGWGPSSMRPGRAASIRRRRRSRCSPSSASTRERPSSTRCSTHRCASQADELNRLAGVQADFLRGVTHDLQTPLTSIAALATELRADEGLSESARADLDSIAHQAERLRRMVSQLLVASRLDAGVLTPQQEVFAVQPLVERTWARAACRSTVRARGRAARRTSPSPIRIGSSRSCGPCSTTR